ncbi:DUF7916 family protein [Novosphingobium terrae]|uniref:DUF7916 family protein n=1 Tax=Novosphingobium terrae TaxID=2726189 RepID=UPI00197E0CA2|nr:hypothetical protein [Novosphingobium terrae]
MKRFLDCAASDFFAMDRAEILCALKSSEGRIVVSESIVSVQPLLGDITNAELAASHGADILLLNRFDVDSPSIMGIPGWIPPQEHLRMLQTYTGRLIGVNLEAVDPAHDTQTDEFWAVNPGQLATAANVDKAASLGATFVVVTGNPGNGVSNDAIKASLRDIRSNCKSDVILITGKMHSSGIVAEGGKSILSAEEVGDFVDNGADIILIPGPGTVPGMTVERASALIEAAHQHGAMAMTAIGTSQEGANIETIRQIALMSKMAGADLHHIGDTGYVGSAIPENITAYSIAIRGIRHTYTRMARSVLR